MVKVICEVLFIIGYARPRDIGNDLFSVGPSSAVILEIYKLDSSILRSLTAEATALFNSFKTGSAERFTVNSSKALASATFLPRTRSTTCRSFLGAVLKLFNLTFTSIITLTFLFELFWFYRYFRRPTAFNISLHL